MADTSNIDQVVAWLDQFQMSFKFDRVGRDQSLGRDIAWVIIRGPDVGSQGGILGRCADGEGPDGERWPPNSATEPPTGGYKGYKERKYGHSEPNRRSGDMLSQQKLFGRTRVEPELVTLVYGLGTGPTGSAAPSGYLSTSDKAITDVEKAAFAHSGQGRKQTKRPFYGFTDEDRHNVIVVCQGSMDEFVRAAVNGARGG